MPGRVRHNGNRRRTAARGFLMMDKVFRLRSAPARSALLTLLPRPTRFIRFTRFMPSAQCSCSAPQSVAAQCSRSTRPLQPGIPVFAACLLAVLLALTVPVHRAHAAPSAMSSDTSAPDPRAITVGFVTGAGGLGDMSFNDMAYGGLRKAQQELGFSLKVLEADATGTAKTEAVAHLVRECDILVLLGAQHTGHARVFAGQYPDKKFIFYEEKVSGIPNLASILFRQHEGSFLAGALAGRVSKTRRVAFLGGTDIPPVAAFAQGFMEGVHHVAPDVVVEVHHVSGPGDFSGFNNPDEGFTMAAAMFEDGVDIIFAVAGLTGNGVIEAARRTDNRYVIGVDSDQDDMARGKVLTSMVKRLDTATHAEVSKAVQGGFTPGVADFGLVSGGVSLTDMRHTRDIITAPVLEELETLRQAIIDGKIAVTDLRP